MRMHTIAPAPNSVKAAKRLGRGIGSGLGKTSGKGHKGQWARSGGGVRPGFEGGQMPLTRRLPKRGFNNIYKKQYQIINIGDLEKFDAGSVISMEFLIEKGVLNHIAECYGLKVLANGELTKAMTVQAAKFSESAKEAIEKAGGKAEVV